MCVCVHARVSLSERRATGGRRMGLELFTPIDAETLDEKNEYRFIKAGRDARHILE